VKKTVKKSKSKSKKRWLSNKNQPPFYSAPKKKGKKQIPAKPKRAKYYSVSLTRFRKLYITTRRFKTTKQNRATKYKQLVIPVYFSSVKEIVISQKFSIPRGKKPITLTSLLQKQIPVYSILIFAGVCGTLFFGWQTIKKPDLQPATTFSIPTPKTTTPVVDKGLPRSEPTRISISRIGIDAGIMTVGKNADGTMETPPVLEYITGWYKLGPTPGEIGPAIIVGHVDNYKGISVFWRLREVLPGDEISITRADGKIVKFKVDALKQFDQDNFPTQEVYGDVSRAELRLITCGGTFNRQTQQYSQNTVVFASATK